MQETEISWQRSYASSEIEFLDSLVLEFFHQMKLRTCKSFLCTQVFS